MVDMMKSLRSGERYIDVECPTCGAKIREPCKTKTGKGISGRPGVHKSRYYKSRDRIDSEYVIGRTLY